MKSKILLFVLLMLFIPANAMSDDTTEEPKIKKINEVQTEQKNDTGLITQVELNRIAINYYKYMFEEEHEWKGMKKKEGDGIIKNITPLKDEELAIGYFVNYNPKGFALISALKKTTGVILMHGGGFDIWTMGVNEGFVAIDDNRFTPMHWDSYKRKVEAYKQNKSLMSDFDRSMWEKLNVPIDNFNEHIDYSKDFHPPKWWLEKKKLKNTQGMIQTEWHQKYPFYSYCPVTKDTTLVGCGPLVMAQLMKFYEYPTVGLENFSNTTYDWANMLAYDSLMTTQTQIDAVARICRDAGTSIGASYSTTLTTSGFDYIADGLARDFNYTAQMKTPATWYSPSNTVIWIDSLKASIGRGEPILYGGLYNFNSQMVDHAWIVNDYQLSTNEFHFNLGSEDINLNNWYPVSEITLDQNAIFHAIPDKNENALTIPYKEDFQDVVTGTSINQIPKYIGVSHTVTPGLLRTFHTYQDTLTGNKSVVVRNSGDNSQWFALKKIKLNCDSVPILKFRHKILDEYGLVGSGSTAMIIEISDDNRLTWNQTRRLDITNYNPDDWNKFVDNIISLEEFKNDTVNIRFRFPYGGSNNFCLIDDIEVGQLGLDFTDLSYDDILQPSDAQSVKVTPSIVTPPKSKGFENYDMVMDFYVKEDSTAMDYTLMYSDSLLENGVFEYPNWDTNAHFGKNYLIKAVARTKSDNTTLTSTEIRVQFSGRKCYITYPADYQDLTSFFDFELPLTIEGYIEAEPAFRDTLDGDIVLVGGWIWDYRYDMWIDDPAYADSSYFCDVGAYDYSLTKEGDKSLFDYKEVKTDYTPKRIHSKEELKRIKPTISSLKGFKNINENFEFPNEHFLYNRSSELQGLSDYYTSLENESKSATKDLVQFDTTYYEHATSLNLKPGFYWVECGAYYKYNLWTPIAEYDGHIILIPNWKLKLKEDPWYPGAVPHNSLREYAQNDDVYIEIWRPFTQSLYNIVDITVTRDYDNTEVATFQVDYNTKGKKYVYWETTGTTEPGFYTITATEQFENTSSIVTQKETIQICPLYEHWEHSGLWSDIWEINIDNDYFRIHNYIAGHAGIGDYSLGATYVTETGESIDESLSSDGVSFNLQHDAIFEVFMGLPYDGANFQEMYADYKMLLSKDGGISWTAIRQANVSDYNPYSWNPTAGYKFINWWTPIKNTVAEENLIVKFVSQNQIAPQDTISQQICYDEIQIRYRTDPVPDGGQNFAGNTDGSKVDLSWDAPVTKGLTPTLYYIYRNGSDLAVTSSTSYTDNSIIGDTMYNYSVVAYYEDSETGAWDVSSMLDCSVDIFVSSLTTPANVIIAENTTNVTITWNTVAGASSYMVYSSVDPYGTFTVDTSGTFNGEQWVAPLTESKLFYYVVATDTKRTLIKNTDRLNLNR